MTKDKAEIGIGSKKCKCPGKKGECKMVKGKCYKVKK